MHVPVALAAAWPQAVLVCCALGSHLLDCPLPLAHDRLNLFRYPFKQLSSFIAATLLEYGDFQTSVGILHDRSEHNKSRGLVRHVAGVL